MYKRNEGFTLVELIVVITILAILWTIWFISLQWFARETRDSARVSDLKSIEKVITLYQLREWSLPTPGSSNVITYKWTKVWEQWIFSDDTRRLLWTQWQISATPVDPLTWKEYFYSISNNQMLIWWIFEWSLTALNNWIWTQTYAAGTKLNSIVKWTYNWVTTKVSTGWIDYILALPSIITSSTWTVLEEIITNKQLVFNGYQNLGSNYNWTEYDVNWWFDFAPNMLEVWSWSIYDLSVNQNERLELVKNIQKAYGQTVIDNDSKILALLNKNIDEENSSESVKQFSNIFLKNNLDLEIKQSKSDWILPSDIRQIFSTWSIYTKYWETNNCDPDTMNVVEVNPWIDPFSWINHIPANTIYKLKDGDYILPAPLYASWDCVWIIGNNNTILYTSTKYYPFSIGNNNIILSNLIIDWINDWLWWTHEANYVPISFNSSNSTIANFESFNSTYWILTISTSANHNYYYNLKLHDNISYGLHLFWHDNIVDNITSYNNGIWIRLEHALNNTLSNINTYGNNTWLLINFESNYNTVKNVNWYNNIVWVSLNSHWNILSNMNLYNNSNIGLSIYTGDNNFVSNVVTYNNYIYWLSVETSDNNIISNLFSYSNLDNGVYFSHGSDNNVLNNISSFNNGWYGLSSRSSISLNNKYYWDMNIYDNDLGSTDILYSSLISWDLTDQVAQDLGFWDWLIDESEIFSQDNIVIPDIKWWDYSLIWSQCLGWFWCTNEVLLEWFSEDIKYTHGQKLLKQNRLLWYNSWTLNFENYGVEFDDYNTYMKIWKF